MHASSSSAGLPRRGLLRLAASVGSLLVATSVTSCGGGVANLDASLGASAAPAVCGGQPRPPLDCSAEFKYDAIDGQAGLHVGSVVNLSGSFQQKALHDIDQQTALYIAESRRLCDEYNKCVVDRDAYATRSENLRRRMAKVPELLDGVKSATGDEAQRAALAEAYRQIVPDDARTDLRVSLAVLARRPNEPALAPITKDATLPSGTHVAFGLDLSRAAYVYLFQKSASGAVHVLFPDARIAVRNPVPAGSPLQLPAGGASFKLDDKDLGIERVYLVASLHPVGSLAAASEKAGDGAVTGEAIARVTAIEGGCASRGLALDEGAAPAPGCVRPRGLSLDVGGAQAGKSSLVAATEAADDTIATVFSFRHVR